jgi:hypothetical protein
VSDEGLIEPTALLVDKLDKEIAGELSKRYARQNRLRVLDRLLDRFESLNLRDAQASPSHRERLQRRPSLRTARLRSRHHHRHRR